MSENEQISGNLSVGELITKLSLEHQFGKIKCLLVLYTGEDEDGEEANFQLTGGSQLDVDKMVSLIQEYNED